MKIILDHNIPMVIKDWLKKEKPEWDVYHTSDLKLTHKTGGDLFVFENEERPVIITSDEVFTDIKIFEKLHNGIIQIDIWPLTEEEIRQALRRLINEVSDTEIPGAIIMIDKSKIKTRKI